MDGDVRDPEDEGARGNLKVGVPLLNIVGGYNRLELERGAYQPSPDAPVLTVVIAGSGHAYFSDLIYFYQNYADVAWHARHRYELDANRIIKISRDYIAAFLDNNLKGAPKNVLLQPKSYSAKVENARASGYPEAELTIAID